MSKYEVEPINDKHREIAREIVDSYKNDATYCRLDRPGCWFRPGGTGGMGRAYDGRIAVIPGVYDKPFHLGEDHNSNWPDVFVFHAGVKPDEPKWLTAEDLMNEPNRLCKEAAYRGSRFHSCPLVWSKEYDHKLYPVGSENPGAVSLEDWGGILDDLKSGERNFLWVEDENGDPIYAPEPVKYLTVSDLEAEPFRVAVSAAGNLWTYSNSALGDEVEVETAPYNFGKRVVCYAAESRPNAAAPAGLVWAKGLDGAPVYAESRRYLKTLEEIYKYRGGEQLYVSSINVMNRSQEFKLDTYRTASTTFSMYEPTFIHAFIAEDSPVEVYWKAGGKQ